MGSSKHQPLKANRCRIPWHRTCSKYLRGHHVYAQEATQ